MFAMLISLIGQDGGGGLDFIWLLVPLLCCMLLMGQRGEGSQSAGLISDSFYTRHDIQEAFDNVEEEVSRWRADAEGRPSPGSILAMVRRFLGGGSQKERFVIDEKIPPRLIRLSDATGPVYFEFTEVEGGGTVVKASYDSALKSRVAKLKTFLPVRVPAAPVELKCPSCGKPVLKEFNLCPYCGYNLSKE
jgi:hypothetical protein